MSDPIDLFGDTEAKRLERGEQAYAALLRNRAVLSGNRVQPKILWGIRPFNEKEIRRIVEADGMSPFDVLQILPLDRRAVKLSGAPVWAQTAYLVMVRIRALFVDE